MDSKTKHERKIVEKNRRIKMKALCFRLVSLIPDSHFAPAKELLSQLDQLEQSAAYIKILRETVEELRRKKTQALSALNSTNYGTNNADIMDESNLPILKIKNSNSELEVFLISGPNKIIILHQIISIIEQEGAEVLNVSTSTVGHKILHSFHAQVKVSRLGVDISRISGRIHQLIS